jgi:lactosylceramide 4-alpha-galactosyltransferase
MRVVFIQTVALLALLVNAAAGQHAFHLVWTTPIYKFEPWRAVAIERICHYHPASSVYIYSNTLKGTMPVLETLLVRGCNVTVWPIDRQLFIDSPLLGWWADHEKQIATLEKDGHASEKPYLHAHLSDVLRLWVLYKHGGVYLDFDVYLLRPLTGLANFASQEDGKSINNAVMGFEKGHPVMEQAVNSIPNRYNPSCWGCIGPGLLTSILKDLNATKPGAVCMQDAENMRHRKRCLVNVYQQQAFYPIHYSNVLQLSSADRYNRAVHASVLNHAFTLHVWTHALSGHSSRIEKGSLVWRLSFVQDDVLLRQNATL